MTTKSTTTQTVSTLDALNVANTARLAGHGLATAARGDYTIQRSYAIGRCGSTRLGTEGGKLHLLSVETVIDGPVATTPRGWRVGSLASVTGCNRNGQHTGVVLDYTDLQLISCAKCRATVARVLEMCGLKGEQE